MDVAPLVPGALLSFLGALAMLLVCLGATGLGHAAFRRPTEALDPAVRIGVCGLLGLGLMGSVALLIGIVPGGAAVAWIPIIAAAVAGMIHSRTLLKSVRASKPVGAEWLAIAALGVALLFAFIVLLAPSTASDWDSIAYHMALPKLYIGAGQIAQARFSSHSAFPEAVELLFLLPLKFGLQSGAKAVLLGYSTFGALALFGLARERYGRAAGWWAAVGFAATPVVLWESGSAYVDVAHGLFAGLAVIFALRSALEGRQDWILSGVLLGFGCGTKYTGLQTAGVLFLILAVLAAQKRFAGAWRPIASLAGLAFLFGGAWYAKNVVTTGNPVYPFLYEQFRGADWDQKRSNIYRDEQLSFGVGVNAAHKDWSQLGHAIFGLAYQPGRYVNPQQTVGGGSPLGAVGIAVFAGLLFWALARKPEPLEGGLLAFVGVSLVLWFALSQQSRYATTLAVPACLMLGGAAVSGSLGRLVGLATALQTAYTLRLFASESVRASLPVALGSVEPLDYLHANLPFSEAAEVINALPSTSKVALYDQVFGYYLNRSYFWANPGHSTVIPYDSIRSGVNLAGGLRSLGFTHIYVEFPGGEPSNAAFAAALDQAAQLPSDLEQKWRADWTASWKVYLIEAIKNGDVVLSQSFRRGRLYELKKQ